MSRIRIIQFCHQIRTFTKSLSEHPLKEGVPKVFANGSNEVSYADTSGVSCWWG